MICKTKHKGYLRETPLVERDLVAYSVSLAVDGGALNHVKEHLNGKRLGRVTNKYIKIYKKQDL